MRERVLITGASGLLGSSLAIHLLHRNIEVIGVCRSNCSFLPFPNVKLDLTNKLDAQQLIRQFRPTTVVHAAAMSKVVECEKSPGMAYDQNVVVTESIVEASVSVKSHLVFISTDQVFGGETGHYSEKDSPAPTHVYGRTKLAAESAVASSNTSFLIARSNNIVGRNMGWGQSFTDTILERLLCSKTVQLFNDQHRSPIHIRTIISSLSRCILQRVEGVLHLGGPEKQSRYDTGVLLARAFKLDENLLVPSCLISHPDNKVLHKDGSFETTLFKSLFPDLGESIVLHDFERDAKLRIDRCNV